MPEKSCSNKQHRSPGRAIIYILIIILGMFLISMVIVFSRTDPQEIYEKNANLRLEVLNGCGVDRLALRVTNLLRKRGFNVVKIGDTRDQDFDETVVLERGQDNMANAKYFAKQFGCKNVDKDIDQALYIDITVIIGKDYKKIFTDVEKEF
jgi:hypothetical protein